MRIIGANPTTNKNANRQSALYCFVNGVLDIVILYAIFLRAKFERHIHKQLVTFLFFPIAIVCFGVGWLLYSLERENKWLINRDKKQSNS